MNKTLLYIVFFSLLIIIVSPASAQVRNYRIEDSLTQRLSFLLKQTAGVKNDSLKAATIGALCQYYCLIDFDKTLKYADSLIAIAEGASLPWALSEAYYYKGRVYGNTNLPVPALKSYLKAIEIAEASGHKERIPNYTFFVGLMQHNQGSSKAAISYYEEAIRLAEEVEDYKTICYACGSLAMIYYDDSTRSDAYMLRSIKIAKEKLNDPRQVAMRQSSYGSLLLHRNLPLAHSYIEKALKYYIGSKDSILLSSNYYSMAQVYEMEGHYKEAILYYEKALKHEFKKNESPHTRLALANLYSRIKNYGKAYEFAMDYIRTQFRVKTEAVEINEITMKMKFSKQQFADSLQKVQEQQIAAIHLQKQKTYSYIGFTIAILLLMLSFFIFRNYNNQKQSNKLLSVEKQKSEKLLLNILPHEVANELKETGSAQAKQFNDVTVLFTDFVNFTGISAQLSPTELVSEIHKNFTAFDAIIERNGLEKIKTIGDAYLAVCGLPSSDGRHAQKTVQAALEIKDFIAERSKNENVFQVRMGIHSGSVVAGIVGVKKFAYDIWGDTVNTAARMEQNSEGGKINISSATYELVKDEFVCEPRGKIRAKNIGEVDMYFVYEAKAKDNFVARNLNES